MSDIKIFNAYQSLALEGKANLIICNVVPEHGQLVGNIDSEDRFYMRCLGCKYKVYPSSDFVNKMLVLVKANIKE